MKLVSNIVLTSLLVLLISFSAYASEKAADTDKPIRLDVEMLTIDATVESIDREARTVSLKNEKGEVVSFTLDEGAGRLDNVNTGDHLSIEYLESVAIQVFAAGEVEPGLEGKGVLAGSEPGEKPAAMAVDQVSVVVTIEAIDLENDLVTLKAKNGESKTVSPEYPENLKKVNVGDQVKITYTSGVAFSVTAKETK